VVVTTMMSALRGLSRRLLNLAERGGSGAQHTALATVVKIAEGGREGIPT
jgi:hypothetical protein